MGGIDVRGFGYKERMERVRLMTRALTKLTCRDLTPIRTKAVYDLKQLGQVCAEHVMEKTVKGVCYASFQ